MLKFESRDPFPIVFESDHTYLEAQTHAAAVDHWLGLQTEQTEKRLAVEGCRSKAPTTSRESQQLWFGLATQNLLTPYTEIRSLLSLAKPEAGQVVVDLGAAYGRMGFVINRCHPGVSFIGYEYVGERVHEGRRSFKQHSLQNADLEHADLSSAGFIPEIADIYFLYDYGTLKAIEKTLYDLKKIARLRPIVVIGRGRHCRYAIEARHSWLGKVNRIGAEERATVYCSDLNDRLFVSGSDTSGPLVESTM